MCKARKIILIILGFSAIAFYILADILINPLILWTALPLYIGYYQLNAAIKQLSVIKLYACYGFLAVSISVSLFYHATWYVDWQGTRSGDSTSALIFIFFPVYAVILGYAGYSIGYLAGAFSSRRLLQ